MYLLNLFTGSKKLIIYIDLHSTMYLLNRQPLSVDLRYLHRFTFHYVSIKSAIEMGQDAASGIYIPLCIY